MRIERVISDNVLNYRRSHAFQQAVATIGAKQKFIRSHCRWTGGKVGQFNRTLAEEWAYARPCASNDVRTREFYGWLWLYDNTRPHAGIGGVAPISRFAFSSAAVPGISETPLQL